MSQARGTKGCCVQSRASVTSRQGNWASQRKILAASALGIVVASTSSIRDRPAAPSPVCSTTGIRWQLMPIVDSTVKGRLRHGGPLRHADRRRLAAADIPVTAARPEPGEQMAEQRLLEQRPGSVAGPPAPELGRLVQPLTESLERVVQRPAERGLADHVAAVARHALGQVCPAGDHRDRVAALQDADAVAFLQPDRGQRLSLQRRRPAGYLVCAAGISGD